jgi:hypothetical protein
VFYSTALGISCAELEFLIEVCTSAILVCTNICQCVRLNKQNKGVGFPFRIIFLVSQNTIQSETKKLFHEILLVLQITKNSEISFCFVKGKNLFCFVNFSGSFCESQLPLLRYIYLFFSISEPWHNCCEKMHLKQDIFKQRWFSLLEGPIASFS